MPTRSEIRRTPLDFSFLDGRARLPEWEPEPLPLPISLPYDGRLDDLSRTDETAEIEDDEPRTPGVVVIDLV